VDVARIRVSAPGSLPAARADPAALERVLVNLVTNALKYSPPSEHVDIALAARGGAVTLTVRDRGPGIPREEQGRVFERFYRARAAVRKEGLGLGLYISRLLTEQMGGTISLESAQGKGTAFTVALPAAVDSPALANPVA
jgi:two-component system sensor histidine kinase KdpD